MTLIKLRKESTRNGKKKATSKLEETSLNNLSPWLFRRQTSLANSILDTRWTRRSKTSSPVTREKSDMTSFGFLEWTTLASPPKPKLRKSLGNKAFPVSILEEKASLRKPGSGSTNTPTPSIANGRRWAYQSTTQEKDSPSTKA